VARLSTTPPPAAKNRRAREYETIYIMRPNVDPDEADRVATRSKEIIANRQGKLLKLENWGRRKLAYVIKRESRGVFVYLKYAGYDDVVAELERNLRLIDSVVRFQTILIKPEVIIDEYQVDAADLNFQRLEVAEEEEDPGIARRLGLVERPRPQRPEERAENEPESFGDDVDDSTGGDDEDMMSESEGPDLDGDDEPEKPTTKEDE
jgi:small subunit ribosomal protein S6